MGGGGFWHWAGKSYIVARAQRNDRLGVDIGSAQCTVNEDRERLVDCSEDVEARHNGCGVDKGVLEVRVAGEQL